MLNENPLFDQESALLLKLTDPTYTSVQLAKLAKLKEKEDNSKIAKKDSDSPQSEEPAPPVKRKRGGDDDGGHQKKKNGQKPKRKTKKDPNAPPRAMSAYVFFAKERRPVIAQANQGSSFGEVSKLVGAAWKSTSDADKEKYKLLEAEDKVRFGKDMIIYNDFLKEVFFLQ